MLSRLNFLVTCLICAKALAVESSVVSGLAQQPLFMRQAAAVNVLLLMDDSVSMQFELAPQTQAEVQAGFVFPRSEGIYGGGDYANNVATLVEESAFNARSRSPRFNLLYYHPGVTYTPWPRWDGSRYPAAEPSCAWHNPERRDSNSAAFCRNLLVENGNVNGVSWIDCNQTGACSTSVDDVHFWPASYFWYDGTAGGDWDRRHFSRVDLRSGEVYRGHGRERRHDCANAANAECSYNEEIRNFANWYSYYRSAALRARAGIGAAFAGLDANLRLGYGSFNTASHTVDGVVTPVISSGVRPFADVDHRQAFYTWLYGSPVGYQQSPLRLALDAAGKYYSRRDNRGPWGAVPGSDDPAEQLACRRNYAVLMTDGYDDGDPVSGDAGQNNDGVDGPVYRNLAGEEGGYQAVSPFTDRRDNTLADVAMYYWKHDLRVDLSDEVPVSKVDPAFWQHMVTYAVGVGFAGEVDPDGAYAAIATGSDVRWPDPAQTPTGKIDDLLHAAINARGRFLSVESPEALRSGLSAIVDAVVDTGRSSSVSLTANANGLDAGTIVYQASFDSLAWTGRLAAYRLNRDGSLGTTVWDTDLDGIPTSDTRPIYTALSEPGSFADSAIAFTEANWEQLTELQRSVLRDGGDDTDGKALLNWLRGDQVLEGIRFRQRPQLLGDIVNSEPLYVGATENDGFRLLEGEEGASYTTFLQQKATRSPMIYVGANDGMLHGFNADSGAEVMAFIPAAVFANLPELAGQHYSHRYYVDGSPRALDVRLSDRWATVLVAATGAGGRGVFALDISHPDRFSAEDFLWEFATADDAVDRLGTAMSEPVLARLQSGGKWVAIFGNGYDSGDTVKLFIVDLVNGHLLKAINTGMAGDNNGLATAVPVDVDDDRITDFVYAGDLQGNLWKFDLRGAEMQQWGVALSENGVPSPLFTALDPQGNPQPITQRPVVGRHRDGGYMVYFGTGSFRFNGDAGVTGSPQVQSLYGIRDNGAMVKKTDLLQQSLLYEGIGRLNDGSFTDFPVRLVSNRGAATASDYGWYIDLLSPENGREGERSIVSPTLRHGRVIATTLIPTAQLCGHGGRSWLMELDAQNGGQFSDPVLDVNNDGKIDISDKVQSELEYYSVSGRGFDEIMSSPRILDVGDTELKFLSENSGGIAVQRESGDGARGYERQSWRQIQ